MLLNTLEQRIAKLTTTDMVLPQDTRRFRRLGEQFLNKLGEDIRCKLIVTNLIGRHDEVEICLTKEAAHLLLKGKEHGHFQWEVIARNYSGFVEKIREILDKEYNLN